jgi:hypothetical protein
LFEAVEQVVAVDEVPPAQPHEREVPGLGPVLDRLQADAERGRGLAGREQVAAQPARLLGVPEHRTQVDRRSLDACRPAR